MRLHSSESHPPPSHQLSPFSLHVHVRYVHLTLNEKKQNRQPNDIFYDNYFLNEQNTLNVY